MMVSEASAHQTQQSVLKKVATDANHLNDFAGSFEQIDTSSIADSYTAVPTMNVTIHRAILLLLIIMQKMNPMVILGLKI